MTAFHMQRDMNKCKFKKKKKKASLYVDENISHFHVTNQLPYQPVHGGFALTKI